MSPAKKKTRKATAKKAPERRKPASKKATSSQGRAAKKAPAKKKAEPKKKTAAKATPAKERPAAKAAPAKSKADEAPSAAPKTEVPEAAPAAAASAGSEKAAGAQAAESIGRTPPSEAHPKFGVKHTCFRCGAKFYDLFRPEPLCPKCGADQREAPKIEIKYKPAPQPKRAAKRSMAPLLDDEDDDAVYEDVDDSDLDLMHPGADLDDPDESDLDEDIDS